MFQAEGHHNITRLFMQLNSLGNSRLPECALTGGTIPGPGSLFPRLFINITPWGLKGSRTSSADRDDGVALHVTAAKPYDQA